MFEWLKTILGSTYTEDIDKKVAEEIGKGFVAKSDFNATKAELTTAQATIKERDNQLETLNTSTGDVNTLKTQITTLQTENAAKDKAHATEITKLKTDAAVEKALSSANAKNTTAAKALLSDFLSTAELKDDGTIKGLGDAVQKLTAAADTSFLFDTKDPKATISGASPAGSPTTPPSAEVSAFETRLAEARKNNDNLSAIVIKQEAAAVGVMLI